jgi:drug/metabolite transporter (DMT)-like permease
MLLMGDLLCLSSAVFIAMDIVLSKRARSVMPLFAYSLVTCFMCLLLLTGLSLVLEDTVLFSMHPRHGAFGWLSSPSLAGLTVAFGLLEGLVGVLGFNFAVKYVPPLIFSSVQLLDPGITGLMSWGAGLEAFRRALSWASEWWPSASESSSCSSTGARRTRRPPAYTMMLTPAITNHRDRSIRWST